MAIELITGYGGDSFEGRSSVRDSNAISVEEAASAGIHSVEKLMNMISEQKNHDQPQQEEQGNDNNGSELGTVVDMAVKRFREMISLLDKPRTGHARFRRAPPPTVQSVPLLQLQQTVEENSKPKTPFSSSLVKPEQGKTEQVSAFKAYCRTPLIRHPPPPPQNHHHHPLHQPLPPPEKNGARGSVNFSVSPSVSAANSYISTLTGESEGFQRPCRSSGFQITHVSLQGNSYMGKPPLSSNSMKRKCNSMEFPGIKCGSSSAQCHCSKKRYAPMLLLCNLECVWISVCEN